MYYKISCSIQTGVDTPLNPKKSDGNKKRTTEGYRPAFLIYIDGVPLEIVETERQLAATAASRNERKEATAECLSKLISFVTAVGTNLISNWIIACDWKLLQRQNGYA